MTQSDDLVGRARELEELLAVAGSGSARGVVLDGPAGVGKTRLAEALVQCLERDDAATAIRVIATSALRSVPLGALSDFVPEVGLPERPDLELLCALVSRQLRERAAGRRVVILVDDAHHLDPLSASLLQRLRSSTDGFAVFTVRSGEATTEELVRLWTSDQIHYVELGALDRSAAGRLAEAVLGGPLESGVLEEIWRLTEGNPLFIVEMVRGAISAGTLVMDEDGRWSVRGGVARSPRVLTTIGARINRLDDAAKDVCAAVGLLDPIPLSVLTRVGDPSVVDSLQRAAILVSGSDPTGEVLVRFAHPLFAELVGGGGLAGFDLRRHRIARPLAEALALRPSDSNILRAADLLVSDAAVRRGDSDLLEAAASAALARNDSELAHRHARCAIERTDEPTIALKLLAATCELATGRGDRGFVELFESVSSTADRSIVTSSHAYALIQLADRPQSGLRLLEERRSLSDLGDDPTLAGMQCYMMFFFSGASETLEKAGAVIEEGLDESHPASIATLAAAASAATMHGMPEQSRRWTNDALSMWTAQSDAGITSAESAHMRDHLVFNDMVLKIQTGEMTTALQRLEELFELLRAPELERLMLPALCLLYRGHLREAGLMLDAGVDALALAPLNRRAFSWGMRAWHAAMLGDSTAANEWLTRQQELPGSVAGFRWMGERSRVLILASDKDLAASCELAHEIANASGVGSWGRTQLLHDVVRHGGADTSTVAELASQAARPGATWLDVTCHAHARALVERDGSALDAVSSAFETGGLDLCAAEASAQAAHAHRQEGSNISALASTERAMALLNQVGHARTPPLDLLDPNLDQLTERERVVAGLAADGLSNKEIADQLGISHRTVGNQLQAVYSKLGVHDRTSLEILARSPE